MKPTKVQLILLLCGFAAFLVAFVSYTDRATLGLDHILVAAMVFTLVPVSALVGIRRLRQEASGLKMEDEMTRAVRAQAASNAFGMSFFIWMGAFVISLIFQSGASIFILFGCLGMVGIYAMFHALYANKGLPDEDAHS